MALEDRSAMFERRVHQALLDVNKYAGEQFRINAHNRVDQTIYSRGPREPWELTGNLKASIGYVVLHNGGVAFESFPGGGVGAVEGKKIGRLVGANTRGFSLVAVAGMDYAAAVESKGYDVISGPAKDLKHQHHRLMTQALKKLAYEAG